MLTDRLFLSLIHLRQVGRWPNLRQPRTFNERLLHRTLIGRPDLRAWIDKAEARDQVARCHGAERVPRRLWLGETECLPWGDLPHRFVISATHGSGMTMIINNKETLDLPTAGMVMRQWLGFDYSSHFREALYANIQPRILVEENLGDTDGTPPPDYKFYCFHGVPRYVHVDLDRHNDPQRVVFDMSWSHAPFGKTVPNARTNLPKPGQFEEMVDLAARLSEGFPFVRVDLFVIDDQRVVFGEWTFLPASGCGPFIPGRFDRLLGDLIADPSARLP